MPRLQRACSAPQCTPAACPALERFRGPGLAHPRRSLRLAPIQSTQVSRLRPGPHFRHCPSAASSTARTRRRHHHHRRLHHSHDDQRVRRARIACATNAALARGAITIHV